MVATKEHLSKKFVAVEDAMNMEFVERTDFNEALMLALVARTHLFVVGPPGIAKSMNTRHLVEHRIEGLDPEVDYFDMLMMAGSTPEEVFGPLSLQGLKQDRYQRMVEGYLPAAKVAFVDEIFKGNSAILNSLLTIMMERRFRNDGKMGEVPLWTLIGASNEEPEGAELEALYDRFVLKLVGKPIQEPGNLNQVFRISLGQTQRSDATITWDDIEQAHAEASEVEVPDEVLSALIEVKQDLKSEHEIVPTDRKMVQSLDVVRAAAWLDGCDVADIPHLRALRFSLWDDHTQAPLVEKKMLSMVSPMEREAIDLLERVRDIQKEFDRVLRDDLDEDQRTTIGCELEEKVEAAREQHQKILKGTKNGKMGRKSAKVTECGQAIRYLTIGILTKLFDVSEDEIDEEMVDGS